MIDFPIILHLPLISKPRKGKNRLVEMSQRDHQMLDRSVTAEQVLFCSRGGATRNVLGV